MRWQQEQVVMQEIFLKNNICWHAEVVAASGLQHNQQSNREAAVSSTLFDWFSSGKRMFWLERQEKDHEMRVLCGRWLSSCLYC